MPGLKQLFLVVILTMVWVGGGLMVDETVGIIGGGLVSVIGLAATFCWRRQLIFPRYFEWYTALIGVMTLSLFWSADRMLTLQYVMLSTSGALWWISARTLASNKGYQRAIKRSLFAAGVVFTGLWAISTIWQWPADWYGPSSLVVEASAYKNHNHIGDWWSMLLVLGWGQWEWLLPGLVMVWTSRSRSAVLGLMAGLGYVSWVNRWRQRYRPIWLAVGAVGSIMLVGLGSAKTTLGSRDYFIQSAAGLALYPLGTGLGNFETISRNVATHWWGRGDFSTVTHSLPLEWISGMGWLGLVGWVWLGLVSWNMGTRTSKTVTWRALYWVILVNFLFDTTYFVPSLWYVWFVAMGLGEE